MIDQFNKLLADRPALKPFVDNPRELSSDSCDQCGFSSAVTYLWDGYMNCAVIFHSSRYYDVQDMPDELEFPDRLDQFNSYGTLDELMNAMNKTAEGDFT